MDELAVKTGINWRFKHLKRLALALIGLMVVAYTIPTGVKVLRTFARSNPVLKFDQASYSLPSTNQVKVLVDSRGYSLGYVKAVINFEKGKVRLSKNPDIVSTLSKKIDISTMSQANRSGKIVIILGLDPSKKNNRLNNSFELARLSFVPANSTVNMNSVFSFVPSEMQLVDINYANVNFSTQNAKVVLNSKLGPTSVRSTSTPRPTSTGTGVTPTSTSTTKPQASATPILPTQPPPPPGFLPAFPGAEGFGASAKGGRGGKVIEVTNLNDSGAGSLRDCALSAGPRICVFRVAGTITLNSDIDIVNPYLTIAGQTAPGGGITLKAANPNSTVHMQVRAPEVIIRYIRSRPGTTVTNSRALSINNGASSMDAAVKNVVIDHNSFSWSGDELTIFWLATNNISYQWNIASESLPPYKGPSFGEDGGGYFSVHHNLIAHHSQRLPQVSASVGPVDIVNNLVYNPGGQASVVKNGTHANYVTNYIKAGPNSTLDAYIKDGGAKGPATGYYVEGNYLVGIPKLNTAANQVFSRYPAAAVTMTTAQAAYEDVLNRAGAYQGLDCNGGWFGRRDAVDIRVIQSVRDGTRGHGGTGYITSPADVGGWPVLPAGTPCTDSDHDGMADSWETNNFGNTSRGSATNSSSDYDVDGYTDLEEFLNGTNPKL